MFDSIINFLAIVGLIFICSLSIRLYFHFKLVFKRMKMELVKAEEWHKKRDTKGRVFLTFLMIAVYAVLAIPALAGVVFVLPIFLCDVFDLLVHIFDKEEKLSTNEQILKKTYPAGPFELDFDISGQYYADEEQSDE